MLVAILWLVIVPLRLRSLGVLALGALAAAPVAAWALSRDPFTEILQPLSAREDVAPTFGLLVLGLVLVLGVAGLLVESIGRRSAPSLATRRRAGLALAAIVAVVALAGLGAVAVSDRGLAGTVSDRVDELTSEESSTPRGAARLGSVSSSRAGYWRQAWEVFEEQPLIGRGANSFGVARLLYRRDAREAEQAHGFMAQTLSDLGLLGAVIALALLAAWLAAAGRATGLLPRRGARVPHGSEQAALVALALCAVGFGAHSAIDWTWFVPGPTMAALVAAGFVAGRGSLPVVGSPAAPPAPARTGRPGAGRVIAAAAVLVTAVLCAWAVWQPERAARATQRSSELLEAGDTAGAARAGGAGARDRPLLTRPAVRPGCGAHPSELARAGLPDLRDSGARAPTRSRPVASAGVLRARRRPPRTGTGHPGGRGPRGSAVGADPPDGGERAARGDPGRGGPAAVTAPAGQLPAGAASTGEPAGAAARSSSSRRSIGSGPWPEESETSSSSCSYARATASHE